ncbi:protein neuralized [Aplysia californica]|uniref:Protein neuralized n=1 Tax=Aplysia californica TaxID=6500 RepID=A0ABM1A9L8_APLCA|nr:protein neuralized [Aplysia californica]
MTLVPLPSRGDRPVLKDCVSHLIPLISSPGGESSMTFDLLLDVLNNLRFSDSGGQANEPQANEPQANIGGQSSEMSSAPSLPHLPPLGEVSPNEPANARSATVIGDIDEDSASDKCDGDENSASPSDTATTTTSTKTATATTAATTTSEEAGETRVSNAAGEDSQDQGQDQGQPPASVDSAAPARDGPEEQARLVEREHRYLVHRTTCIICQERTISCIFMPCGHVVACEDCAENASTCPICNREIVATANVYLS